MTTEAANPMPVWPLWRRFLFGVFFILFVLIAAPWSWLIDVPGLGWVAGRINDGVDGIVYAANSSFLHVRPVLVPTGGSGDTSFGWAALWTYCCVALAGGLAWSLADRRRRNYVVLNYWLCILLRYYLALVALSYGISKLFLTQMPFPSTSELATPLGDFLPMRLSWLFIGYSAPYQFFSGLVECLAGLLLLWRRTATLGTLLAAGVFLNVAMLNLSYDIPVKIFSLEMVAVSLFLLANESRRLMCFFVLNRPAPGCSIYERPLTKRWQRAGRIALKAAFVALAIGLTTYSVADLYAYYNAPGDELLAPGVYDVSEFVRNGEALSAGDPRRWTELILDGKREGSLRTGDTAFTLRYGRRYFTYDVDSTARTIALGDLSGERPIATLHYRQPDTAQIALQGVQGRDSLQILLRRRDRHFQLAERQFHWLSEQNR